MSQDWRRAYWGTFTYQWRHLGKDVRTLRRVMLANLIWFWSAVITTWLIAFFLLIMEQS